MSTMIKFQFNERKGVEALIYIASKWRGVTAFYASKILYFAEKYHINRYARPIVADTFIAMPNGPVPSTLYDFIKGNLLQAGDPDAISNALSFGRDRYPNITAKRAPDMSMLSASDVECLDEALEHCRHKTFGFLSTETHQDRSWRDAPTNGPMDYMAMLDLENPNYEAIVDEIEEFAAYGSL